jgi:hypothetical protein
MKISFWLLLAMAFFVSPVLADDTDDAAMAAARSFVFAALPGQCDDMSTFADEPDIGDAAYRLSWKPDWGGDNEPDLQATLYRIFCFAGAYNLIHAYVFKPDDDHLSLMTFAEPTYRYDYADEDQTALKSPPQVTGFSTTSTLVNSEFDPVTLTLTSASHWRGLGDAWSGGTWELKSGRFVLKSYDVDPTYDFNNDSATDAQIEKYYRLYP